MQHAASTTDQCGTIIHTKEPQHPFPNLLISSKSKACCENRTGVREYACDQDYFCLLCRKLIYKAWLLQKEIWERSFSHSYATHNCNRLNNGGWALGSWLNTCWTVLPCPRVSLNRLNVFMHLGKGAVVQEQQILRDDNSGDCLLLVTFLTVK